MPALSDDSEFETSPTLLGHLHSHADDQSAWRRFETRYAPLIASWCRRWGAQASDAEDIGQEVLLALCKQMTKFKYDRTQSFRGFLHTIARRAWCDLLDKRRRQAIASGDSVVLSLLENQGDGDAFAEQLEMEWRRELLERAMERVQKRVKPHTWKAFEALTREGLSGAEVAERLDMKIGAVWVAKSKIKKMLLEELATLESEDFPFEGDA